MHDGQRGFTISHESTYFKEKSFFTPSMKDADIWIDAVQKEAQFHDLNAKYLKIELIGAGKFSQVFTYKNKETGEIVALK